MMAIVIHSRFRDVLARAVLDDSLWGSSFTNPAAGDTDRELAWNRLSEVTRTAIRRQADEIVQMLSAIGLDVRSAGEGGQPLELHANEWEHLSEQEHERWMRAQRRGGWRYGPEKDSVTKTHPSMITYAELPESERDKDRERVERFPRLLREAGLGVIRR